MIIKNNILIAGIFLSILTVSTKADLPKEQVYSLFSQANESFRQANTTKDTEQAKRYYEQAILSYERIIDEAGIQNAKLYYNLANAYFLNGQLGKAILNYRRAARLASFDDIHKNLAFARSQRTDQVVIKTQKRVLQTLFFWHYDFATQTKFLLMCILFGLACIGVAILIWFGRSTPVVISTIICGILTICFLISVVINIGDEANNVSGVIIAGEVTARQGDGQNYPPSFKDPLHEGTEFDLLESRPGWFCIKLADDNKGWIPEDSAELI